MPILSSSVSSKKRNRGFTLIEILVVIGVMALLLTITAVYSRTAERQIVLFKEQSLVIGALNRAKSLSLSSYSDAEAPCGYGVNFSSDGTVTIFKELSPTNDPKCMDIDFVYTSPDEMFEQFKLDSNVKFSSLGANNIIFIPPNPLTIIDDSVSKTEAVIKIQTIDGLSEKVVKVTNVGQITAQ